jgi:hypothetical protein
MGVLQESSSLPNNMEEKSLKRSEKTSGRDQTNEFRTLLSGRDLRKLRNNQRVIGAVRDRRDFERLFKLVFASDRPVAMRASDAVEKITRDHPEYLAGHSSQLLELARHTPNKEMKWHLAQVVARLDFKSGESGKVWRQLSYWVRNPNESRIVRVNALQGLFDMCSRGKNQSLKRSFIRTLAEVERSHEPSLLARARVLRQGMARRATKRGQSVSRKKIAI